MSTLKPAAGLLVLAALAATAAATIIFDGSPGTGAPPATLGPYTMTPFPPDTSALYATVTTVASPLGGSVAFSQGMSHRRIGQGWATWSHGYMGDVYYTNGAFKVTLTMPPDTGAFYFYVEPGPFTWKTFTATTDDGTTSGPVQVHGDHGATYFGFYGLDGQKIHTIAVVADHDFSIGEFGVATEILIPKTLYVDDDGALGGDGESWNRATKYLQDALAIASADLGVNEIRVAGGAYKPDQDAAGTLAGERDACFALRSGLAIRGGYRGLAPGGDADDRDFVAFESVLSGDLHGDDEAGFINYDDNSYHVVRSETTPIAAELDGFTVRGGNAEDYLFDQHGGGALLASTCQVRNCRFVANRALAGGALAMPGSSTPVVNDCTFYGNLAVNQGGAVWAGNGPALFTDCLFVENAATDGGAVYTITGTSPAITLVGCLFQDNHAELDGGAVYNHDCVTTLRDCLFRGNHAFQGGAVYDLQGAPTLTRCRFLGNVAQFGGAVCSDTSNKEKLSDCLFSGNLAFSSGGAVRALTGTPALTNCTFSRNEAYVGGGVYLEASALGQFTSCILWGNEDIEGMTEMSQLHVTSFATALVNYSCIQGLEAYIGYGNIGDDPLFVDADGANGLPGTPDDDLRLQAASPCIDKGDPGFSDAKALDLAGHVRWYDGDGDGLARVDMGALEFLRAGDLNCDGQLDAFDIDLFVLALTDPAAYAATQPTCDLLSADVNGDGTIDAFDIDPFVELLTGG